MPKNNRLIMHIDMNSYFASVAQQENQALRDKPIAVMGKGKGTVVIAASKEAKKFGVKTGTRKFEAIQLCKDIQFVSPDFASYIKITTKFLDVFREFTPIIEPFSIDEAFLDLTHSYTKDFFSPVEIGYKIKARLKEKIGSVITCSVGIADNKLMAKFASDLQKPDGLIYLKSNQYTCVLDKYPLTDLCGIGRRTLIRLQSLNIYTFKDLRRIQYEVLKKEFGNVSGRFLYLAARGENYSKVDPGAFEDDPKSISHSETFTENKEGSDLISNVYKLCEKVSWKLRKKNLYTQSLFIQIKDNKFNSYGFKQKLPRYSNNTIEIFQSVIKHIPNNFISRFVCIYASNLAHERLNEIFTTGEQKDKIQDTIDKINEKFGHFTIKPASIFSPDNSENSIDIPFSGLDVDAKIGMKIMTLAKKNMDITKKYIQQSEQLQ